MDADASKDEEGVTRIVDHARDLVRARVDDAEFKAVEEDRGGVKRGATAGRGGDGDGVNSASTTTIRSSNGNPMAVDSDLGPQLFFIFLKFDF
jgi:hypothetical protein